MPMMARMRSLAPAFMITVGFLFVLYMVISDSQVLEILGAGSNNVGEVNGKEVTIQEYNTFIDRALENQKAQTGQDVPEEEMEAFRDRVWEAIVQQKLTDEQIERFGIVVTSQEVKDAILGENPPEFLKRNFIDSLGNFNRQMYESAINDPRNKQVVTQAEEVVKQQLIAEKLQSVLFGSVTISEADLRRKFEEQTLKMTADYALIELTAIPDSSIKLTEDDYKKYYNDNPDKFKVEDMRKLKYVIFPVAATKADSNALLNNLESVYQRVINDTASFESYVKIYSETPYSRDSLDITNLPAELANGIDSLKPNTVLRPMFGTGMAVLYKYFGMNSSGTPMIKASHILINIGEDPAAAEAEANKLYNELKAGANFADYATKYSKDPGSAAVGGDLGWFGKGRMVKEFEEACYSGAVGVVQKPVKSQFGWHIIKVTGRNANKYVFEKISAIIKPSATTRDDVYDMANDFSYLADKNNFEKEAEVAKYQVQETAAFAEDVYSIPGIGVNLGILNFSFDNDVDDVSPVFRLPGGYVVVKVSEIIKAGVKKYEDVLADVKSKALRARKFDEAKKIIDNVAKKINGNLSVAPSIDSRVILGTAPSFTTNGSVPTVGTDHSFALASKTLPLNKVSEPIKGNRGYYLVNVKERAGFDQGAFSIQRNSLRDQLIQERKNYLYNQWLAKLKDEASIEDRRNVRGSR